MIDIAEVKYRVKFKEVESGKESAHEEVREVDFFDIEDQIDLLDNLSNVLPEGGAYLEAIPRYDTKYNYLVNSVNVHKQPIKSYIVTLVPFMEYMGAKFALAPLEN